MVETFNLLIDAVPQTSCDMQEWNIKVKNEKGYTLIELIVTFVLIGIFMLSATAVTSAFMRVHLKVTSASKGQTVADTILEKINGEISQAQREYLPDTETENINYSVLIEHGPENGDEGRKDRIKYINKDGIVVQCGLIEDVASDKTKEKAAAGSLDNEMLVFHYNAVDEEDIVDWDYGSPTYMGMKISQLQFDLVGDNAIKVTVTLYNKKTGYRFTTFKMVECYNLRNGDIVEK